MHARSLLVTLGTSLALAAPAGAAATTTTLGSTAATPTAASAVRPCAGGAPRCTVVQRSSAGTLAAPAAGVVVAWRARSTREVTVRLRTVHPTDDGTLQATASGRLVTLPGDGAVHAFADQVRIAAGDLLALESDGVPNVYVTGTGSFEQVRQTSVGGFDDGQTATGEGSEPGELQLAADVEPDVDGDGKGDLTQDRADLELTGTAPTAASVFDVVSHVYTVTNRGPDLALGVTVTVTGPGVAAPNTLGCRDLDPTMLGRGMVCDLGRLDAGASVTVTPGFFRTTAAPPPVGTLATSAVAATATIDPVLTNNSAALSTDLHAPTILLPPIPPFPPCLHVIRGTRDADVLRGTDFPDRLIGREGRDQLRGFGDADCLEGGSSADVLDGGSGADRLSGGLGDDRLIGGLGDDRLAGGLGDDRLAGGPGADVLQSGRGRDTVLGGAGNDTITARDGVAETIDCGPGRDAVRADRADRLRRCEAVTRR